MTLKGFDENALSACKGKKLVALFWPELQTQGGLWGLRLCWEDGEVWCVDNLSTDISERCEMGSISIEKLDLESDRVSHEIIIHDLSDFIVNKIRVASADNGEGFVSDCAIALLAEQGKELIIATAVPPTTVNFWLSDSSLPRTEFPLSFFEWGEGTNGHVT